MLQLSESYLIADFVIEKSILSHPAWCRDITGLESEDLLKGKKTYSYLLRAGEKISHYYLSFVDKDLLIRHQPFAIIYTGTTWYCRQGIPHGPFITQTIEDLVHRIMHCNPEDCTPVMK